MAVGVQDGTAFERLRQYGSGRVFAGFELRKVTFTSSVLAQHDDPGFGLVVRDATLRDCTFKACSMAGVRVEDVTVDGATFPRSTITGCVFRHVTLTGRIGQFILGGPVRSMEPAMAAAFTEAMTGYYRDVDWALDIRQASFADATVRAVPGELIRRDPARHFLLHRRDRQDVMAMPGAPPLAKTYFRDFYLEPFDTMVAIASQRSKTYDNQLAELQWLRERGLAE